jgi:protein-tyrosine phosphatase
MEKIKILFICMGNICRSPMAEGVFTRKAAQLGIVNSLLIDSAGTHDYHIGAPPDRRAQQTMLDAGYDISNLRGRQVNSGDLAKFDYVLAMDGNNLSHLQHISADGQHKAQLFLNFSKRFAGQPVPDPYYGGQEGFRQVLAMVEDAAEGLLTTINANLKS